MNQPSTIQPNSQTPGTLKWLLLILGIIILGGGGYWYYTKYIQNTNSVNRATGNMTTVSVDGTPSFKATVPKGYTDLGNTKNLLLLFYNNGLTSSSGNGMAISIRVGDSGAFDKTVNNQKETYTDKGNGTYTEGPTRNLGDKTIRQATFTFVVDSTPIHKDNYIHIYDEIKINGNYLITNLRLYQDMDPSLKKQYLTTYQAILDSITL